MINSLLITKEKQANLEDFVGMWYALVQIGQQNASFCFCVILLCQC